MRRKFVRSVLILIAAIGFAAQAATIDFEGLPDGTILTTQYPGLTFTNAIILTAGISLNEFEFPPHSGADVVSDNGGAMTITFAGPVLSFAGYLTYVTQLTLTAIGTGSTQVAQTVSLFNNNLACLAGPPCLGDPGSSPNEWISVALTGGISSVTISGDPAGGSFALDDATYTTAVPSAVPEPETLSLILTSLCAFNFCRRNSRNGKVLL
jgi:hypothetical protein